MNFAMEIELNREWIYEEVDHDIVAEKNFVLKYGDFINLFNEFFPNQDIKEWSDIYEPEEDGKLIYDKAKERNLIVDEFTTNHK